MKTGFNYSMSGLNVLPAKFGPNAQRALQANNDVLGQEVLIHGEPSFAHVAR
jgi:hypothetical protein